MITLIERNAKNLGTYWSCSYAVELRFDGRLKSSIGGDGIPHQVALSEDILLKLKVVMMPEKGKGLFTPAEICDAVIV